MLITKIFNVESSHRVVNCSSKRCKYSIHGHSAVIEVTLECAKPDNGGMGYDFGLMKGTIKEFIDSMDHCHLLYEKDDNEYIEFIKRFNSRYITLPVSPSAEFLSAYIFAGVEDILTHTHTANGEGPIHVYSVRYHETKSGSATCFKSDVNIWCPYDPFKGVGYSPAVQDDWSDDLKDMVYLDKDVYNAEAEQQAPRVW